MGLGETILFISTFVLSVGGIAIITGLVVNWIIWEMK